MEIRFTESDVYSHSGGGFAHGPSKGRNVALERAEPRKGRFREEIGRREAQGGRGAAEGR